MYKGHKTCAICGNSFIAKTPTGKYCSEKCYKTGNSISKRAYANKMKAKLTTNTTMSLSDIERKAREAGMHYGLYVALNNL